MNAERNLTNIGRSERRLPRRAVFSGTNAYCLPHHLSPYLPTRRESTRRAVSETTFDDTLICDTSLQTFAPEDLLDSRLTHTSAGKPTFWRHCLIKLQI